MGEPCDYTTDPKLPSERGMETFVVRSFWDPDTLSFASYAWLLIALTSKFNSLYAGI